MKPHSTGWRPTRWQRSSLTEAKRGNFEWDIRIRFWHEEDACRVELLAKLREKADIVMEGTKRSENEDETSASSEKDMLGGDTDNQTSEKRTGDDRAGVEKKVED